MFIVEGGGAKKEANGVEHAAPMCRWPGLLTGNLQPTMNELGFVFGMLLVMLERDKLFSKTWRFGDLHLHPLRSK
jgi:hypothetical protein